jgi:hypothetical protein
MSAGSAITWPGLSRRAAAMLAFIVASACGTNSPSTPSQSDYAGNWSGLRPHSTAEVGTGVQLTVVGSTITSATVVTEDYFGPSPQPGCQLGFTATGPATFVGNSFSLTVILTSISIAGISTLPPMTTGTFTTSSTLEGTFDSTTSLSGRLSFTISSGTCGGETHTGAVPTPGFGNQIRMFTATRS